MPAVAIEYNFSDEDLPQHFVGVIDDLAGRDRTARLIGVGHGALENLRRGRRKSISFGLYRKIREAALHAIDTKIRQLETQRRLALQGGLGPDDRRILAAAAVIAQLETLLEGTGE